MTEFRTPNDVRILEELGTLTPDQWEDVMDALLSGDFDASTFELPYARQIAAQVIHSSMWVTKKLIDEVETWMAILILQGIEMVEALDFFLTILDA